jgi:hypothetical protein
MNYMGIDNGLNGGMVVLNSEMKVLDSIIMPVIGTKKKDFDILGIVEFLSKHKNANVILERAQPQFRDGRVQAFKTGHGFGMMQGILAALNMSYTIVAPKTWQKKVFVGLNTDDTKLSSILFCKQKWPTIDWRRSDRATNAHDGKTDAACMAYYGAITRV